jgi:hypothetical protein
MTIAVLALLGAWDVTRPPGNQLGAALAVAGIRTYQASLSPWLERTGIRCRFTLSCSRYGAAVIERDGLLLGSWKAATRVLRCGPWTPDGTVDDP